MAMKWIVVGDTTTGGGSVVTGSPFTDIDGKPVARIGDKVVCLRHGPTVIVSGDTAMVIDGQPVARHGDGVACGCKLISAQQMHVFIDSGGAGGKAAAAGAAEMAPPSGPVGSAPAAGLAPAATPAPTASRPAGAPPPQCWIEDYEKSVSCDAYGRYSQRYKADGSVQSMSAQKKYKLRVPVKSGGPAVVEVRFKAEAQSGVTAADVASAKSKLETGISTHWSNVFTLGIEDPPCGKKVLKIEYKVVWVESGQDYTIKIHGTYPREGLSGAVMNVAKSTDAWTYAHEFGHCVGLPDEYSYTSGQTDSVKYYKPDGTMSEAISAPPIKASTAADATIMSSVGNTKVLPRHGWNIAIEAQALLREKIGRTVICDIT